MQNNFIIQLETTVAFLLLKFQRGYESISHTLKGFPSNIGIKAVFAALNPFSSAETLNSNGISL